MFPAFLFVLFTQRFLLLAVIFHFDIEINSQVSLDRRKPVFDRKFFVFDEPIIIPGTAMLIFHQFKLKIDQIFPTRRWIQLSFVRWK